MTGKSKIVLVLFIACVSCLGIGALYHYSRFPAILEYQGMIFVHDGWAGHRFEIGFSISENMTFTVLIDGQIMRDIDFQLVNVTLSTNWEYLSFTVCCDNLPTREAPFTPHTIEIRANYSDLYFVQRWRAVYVENPSSAWGIYEISPLYLEWAIMEGDI